VNKTKPSVLKAILFDMDGVIMDSMDMHFRMWRQIFIRHDIRLTRQDVYLREGEKAEKSIRQIFRVNGKKMYHGQLAEMFQEKRKLLKKSGYRVRVFPGVGPFLKRLRLKKIRLALVTGTRRLFLNKILPRTIRSYFHTVVSADDVSRGKPHPESYLLALRRLRVPKEKSIVVENAPYGIRAARQSGVYCVALASTLAPRYLAEANICVRTHRELERFIHSL
jgi:beta-phosphoglucomutase